MPAPKYVTERRDENTSGTGALLGETGKAGILARRDECFVRRRWGRGKSPRRRILNFENLHGVVTLSVESTPVVAGVEVARGGGTKHPQWVVSRMAKENKNPWVWARTPAFLVKRMGRKYRVR